MAACSCPARWEGRISSAYPASSPRNSASTGHLFHSGSGGSVCSLGTLAQIEVAGTDLGTDHANHIGAPAGFTNLLQMAAQAGSSASPSSAASPRRLRAFGQVGVIDPSQSLDLSCEQLDCTIAAGKEIESAILGGLGSVFGTVVAAIFVQGFLVEGLRFLGDWRNLLFGALIVLPARRRPVK